MSVLIVSGWVFFGLLSSLALSFAVTCVQEREWRAVGMTAGLALPLLGAWLTLLLVDFPGRNWVLLTHLSLGLVFVILLTVRSGRPDRVRIVGEQERVDERDAFFHRFYRLQPGTPDFEAYYREHPEQAKIDEKIRALPPLGGPGSKTFHGPTSQFQRATFEVLERITRQVEWQPTGDQEPASAEELTSRIKGYAGYLGAKLVGCTRLNPAYVYSHIGRSPGKWGEQVVLEHTHAIAIAVEMSHEMIRLAPDTPATTETARQYFEVAKIAMLVARTINLYGYQARAHVDGNYRVMCVPVAVDAGLGELGRIGVLVTPQYGPRVRLAVVTCDLPLSQDEPVRLGVQRFCEMCQKCAEMCPSGSVDRGTRAVYAGAEKWQSRQDGCYRFWRTQGSDCSLCIKVCPYSHPDTRMHNLVRWLISRNDFSRRLMLWADDWFYGRRPRRNFRYPAWHSKG